MSVSRDRDGCLYHEVNKSHSALLFALLFFLPVTESGGQQDLAKRTLEDILRQDILGSEMGDGGGGEIPSPDPVSP